MLNEKISNNPLQIMPEDFYYDTLRVDLMNVLAKVSFDTVLKLTVEEVINKADGSSVNRNYNQLAEDLQPLATALLSKNYQRSDEFIRADEEEKAIVRKLTKDVQDLLTIVKCTKAPEKEEEKPSRQRLGYDETKKENIVMDSESVMQRERIPNIE